MCGQAERLPAGKLGMELLAGFLVGPAAGNGVVLGPGIGRDVAVVDAGGDRYWLLKSDPITFATDEIAHYAVTVNVNDIATAGGIPRWFLATLLLPESGITAGEVASLFEELRVACAGYGVSLVGGHTEVTGAVNRVVIAGSMIGEVAKGSLVRSCDVAIGDAILCTKGVPIEGCAILAREKREELQAAGFDPRALDSFAGFLHTPGICVLEDARAACAVAPVHAMHDPTEGGLATALWELALASDVGLLVEAESIPVLEAARQLCAHFGIDPLGTIASGALLVAVAPDDAARVSRACAAAGIACAKIATAVDRSRGVRLVRDGQELELPRFDQDEIVKAF
jgi:hydrogenase expression/formation protein HypE